MDPVSVSIKVSADDRARFERHGEPVAIGVSFPRGEVSSSESWSLIDEHSTPVPAQTTILDRWGDQSIRWMLVEFQADVTSTGASNYTLVNKHFAIGTGLTLTPSALSRSLGIGFAFPIHLS